MQQRHLDRRTYFHESANTSRKFYINYIGKYLPTLKGIKVLEIGCGEGGNLLPFAQQGSLVTGIDITFSRIEQAKAFFNSEQCQGEFTAINFLDAKAEDYGTFHLILVHDVIEHISQKQQFIQHIKQFTTNDTLIFWGFPAWQMPFGGHQQICRNKVISHLPFIHLLPASVYRWLLEVCRINSKELMEIKQCGITVESFEKLMEENQCSILKKTLWFINPHYQQKFGLKPRILPSWIAHIRYICNFFSTSCFYLTKFESEKHIY